LSILTFDLRAAVVAFAVEHPETSQHEIARRFGCSQTSVGRLLRQAGVGRVPLRGGFRTGNNRGFKHGKSRTLEYSLFHGAKGRAKDQGIEFSLSLDDIVIPEKCPILGIPLFPNNTGKAKPGPNSPTVDRVDNSKGYTKENYWIISFRANTLKSDATIQELRALAAGVRKRLMYTNFPFQKGKLVYIASPFTHNNPAIREARFVEAVICNGWFLDRYKDRDTFFYSPIAHAHTIALRSELPHEWQFWAAFDECFLSKCDELWVLTVPGWKRSTGVVAERKIAEKYGLPIRFIILHPEQPTESDLRYEVVDTEPEDTYVPQYFS